MSEHFVMLIMFQTDQQRGIYYHARESLCFFANPCLDRSWILHPHSFHKRSVPSVHDHRFPFGGITVALNIGDSYSKQISVIMKPIQW